jgi:hypothetical protein
MPSDSEIDVDALIWLLGLQLRKEAVLACLPGGTQEFTTEEYRTEFMRVWWAEAHRPEDLRIKERTMSSERCRQHLRSMSCVKQIGDDLWTVPIPNSEQPKEK